MKNRFTFLIIFVFTFSSTLSTAQSKLDSLLPVRGFCIASPKPATVDSFINFIDKELAPRKVNTLVMRIDYSYKYESHPELADTIALSKEELKKIADACRQNKINLIPQINLLGHQSWANHLNKLMQVYPDFDETQQVKMPVVYQWPNADDLYCKSYCPLHPDVHKVVFDLVDEVCNVIGANAFHAGLDEVFYLGDDKCPRCSGRDKAELFAGEVRLIRDHLAQSNRKLWMWGDRLIDGKATGLGMWEASYNNTHRAIDMIPKDVIICDWHYERPDKTPVYFAMKGLNVITCPWRNPVTAVAQLNDMVSFRQQSSREMKDHFQGMMQTIWTGVSNFLNEYYSKTSDPSKPGLSQWNCFITMFKEIEKLN